MIPSVLRHTFLFFYAICLHAYDITLSYVASFRLRVCIPLERVCIPLNTCLHSTKHENKNTLQMLERVGIKNFIFHRNFALIDILIDILSTTPPALMAAVCVVK